MVAAAAAAAAAPAPTSWQQRLATKRRRRLVVPIQISDEAGDLVTRVARLRGLHAMLRDLPTSTEEMVQRSAEDLAAAETELDDHVVELEFQSLPAHEWDALIALHPSTDPADDGGIAWRTALPVLAAACCTEDGGSDEAWWLETLATDSWTPADLLTLWGALVRLHTRAPSARLPFD